MKRISCKDGLSLQVSFFPFFALFQRRMCQTSHSTGEVSKLVETLQRLTFRKRGKMILFFSNSEHHYPSPLNQERLYVVS